jgi:hypothetical protein
LLTERQLLHVICVAFASRHAVQYDVICIDVHASIEGRGAITFMGGMKLLRSVFGSGHMSPASITDASILGFASMPASIMIATSSPPSDAAIFSVEQLVKAASTLAMRTTRIVGLPL